MTQQDFNNSLQFIQSVLNNDLVPALNTLQISGTVATDTMNDIITHENTIITDLNNLIAALPTIKGDQGLSFTDTLVVKSLTANASSSLVTFSVLSDLSVPLLANSVYEIRAYIVFSTSVTTTGINIQISAGSDSICYTEVKIPITYLPAASGLLVSSPNDGLALNVSSVKSSGVNVANKRLTAVIVGHIKTGAVVDNMTISFASEVSGSSVTVTTETILFLNKVF